MVLMQIVVLHVVWAQTAVLQVVTKAGSAEQQVRSQTVKLCHSETADMRGSFVQNMVVCSGDNSVASACRAEQTCSCLLAGLQLLDCLG